MINANLNPGLIEKIQKSFEVKVVLGGPLKQEALRLRHQVYCLERGYEVSDNGIETDRHDSHAWHAVVTERESQRILAAVRLVFRGFPEKGDSFPMQEVCPAGCLSKLPLSTTAEISRFSISKQLRGQSQADGFLRLCLLQGILRMSRMSGMTHWCALMEPSLLRLLKMSSLHFEALGKPVEHHGLRQPVYGRIGVIMERLGAEKPDLWNFLTEDGLHWPRTVSWKDGYKPTRVPAYVYREARSV